MERQKMCGNCGYALGVSGIGCLAFVVESVG